MTSGAVGMAAALLGLLQVGDMMAGPTMMAGPLPSLLLFAFGAVVFVNGLFLIGGKAMAPRQQGGLMLLYGALMVVVGLLMAGTSLFAMPMATPSAVAMFVLGGLMVVSGSLMTAGKPMVGA